MKFHYGFLEFLCVVVLFDAIDFVVLSNDALVGNEERTYPVSGHRLSDILIPIAVQATVVTAMPRRSFSELFLLCSLLGLWSYLLYSRLSF